MLKSSDIQGRLRLLRYGLIVIVVVTFLVSLLSPYAAVRGLPGAGDVGITSFLVQAIIFTVVVAVLAVIIYIVYRNFLNKTVAPPNS